MIEAIKKKGNRKKKIGGWKAAEWENQTTSIMKSDDFKKGLENLIDLQISDIDQYAKLYRPSFIKSYKILWLLKDQELTYDQLLEQIPPTPKVKPENIEEYKPNNLRIRAYVRRLCELGFITRTIPEGVKKGERDRKKSLPMGPKKHTFSLTDEYKKRLTEPNPNNKKAHNHSANKINSSQVLATV